MELADETLTRLRRAAADCHLNLLVVHGSRGRGTAHAGSDWDLGYLADAEVDVAGLHADLSRVLATDEIDIVNLARASALLRFEAARQGSCVYARVAGTHENFVLEATRFWCDAEPVIRRAQAAVLAELSR